MPLIVNMSNKQTIITCKTCGQINEMQEDCTERKIVTCMCGYTHVLEMESFDYYFTETPFLWFKPKYQKGTYAGIISQIITMENPYNEQVKYLISLALKHDNL